VIEMTLLRLANPWPQSNKRRYGVNPKSRFLKGMRQVNVESSCIGKSRRGHNLLEEELMLYMMMMVALC